MYKKLVGTPDTKSQETENTPVYMYVCRYVLCANDTYKYMYLIIRYVCTSIDGTPTLIHPRIEYKLSLFSHILIECNISQDLKINLNRFNTYFKYFSTDSIGLFLLFKIKKCFPILQSTQ